jgi:hypothetical protein
MAVGVPEPVETEEIRELNGDFSLWDYRITNETFQAPPERYEDPMWVSSMGEPEVQIPNENAIEVYEGTTVAIAGAIVALSLGAFGAWNIAKYDRYRWFTAASFMLGALLLLGSCFFFGTQLPDAMETDAATGLEESFGIPFEDYIDPDSDYGYYFEFSGGYPNEDPRASEQLSYGPGSGWWLAGTGGVFAILAGAMLVGAPQWIPLKRNRPQTREVLRYVPVPTVANLRVRRRYPKKMPAVNRMSPRGYRRVR